jgi:Carboxypeptidase regulatory-like domain
MTAGPGSKRDKMTIEHKSISVKRKTSNVLAATLLRVSMLTAGAFWLLAAELLHAATGSIAGTVKDPSGLAIAGATVVATNADQGIKTTGKTDNSGLYILPSLAVGTYTLDISASGFRPLRRSGIKIDADSALKEDATLQLAEQSQSVTVTESAVQVETASTQMGEVISSQTMTTVALNGRSYTDLLALQPDVVPMSTQTPDSIVMAGATVAISPSGGLNPGNQSISGQREDANGFIVNDGAVKELMNGGTLIVPDLDSIAEFRVLTNNFDAQYGNYSGGIVNVVTKSGSNQLHGTGFEFLRNTDLDARNFFSPERGFYRQNQFGGTIGGPIRKNKIFYFGDYQGTRTDEGIATGLIAVPTLAERSGDLSGVANELTGDVSGPYLAGLLAQKLGYSVST